VAFISLVAASPGSAQTRALDAGCPSVGVEQPFLPWLDPLQYTLAPNGGFEQGSSPWALTGRARVGDGNESYFVRDGDDRRSLYVPEGSTATTGRVCVHLLDLTLRLFARSGGIGSSLQVDVLFQDDLGQQRSVPLGAIASGSAWTVTPPLAIVANLDGLPLLSDGATWVAFRFTAAAGDSLIDDVYVDPFKGG
jgi:hypothetical protein